MMTWIVRPPHSTRTDTFVKTKKSPTSSEVCCVTDATGGPPGPDMITVPPCISKKNKEVIQLTGKYQRHVIYLKLPKKYKSELHIEIFEMKEATSLFLIAICPGGGAGSACDGRATDLPHPIFSS